MITKLSLKGIKKLFQTFPVSLELQYGNIFYLITYLPIWNQM